MIIIMKTCKAQIQSKTALSSVQKYILTENEQEKRLIHTIIESILSSNYISPSIWHTYKQFQAQSNHTIIIITIIIIIINPLGARVVGAPQMILQPVFSMFPCSPLPSGTCRTPGLCIPWCCLPTSSIVRLVFFPLSLWLARWFWPDLMNGRHDHTTAVCVSLQWSGLRPMMA